MYNNDMLPKQYRLKNKSAFNATYRVQNSFYKNGVIMFAGKKATINTPVKIGFVVSKTLPILSSFMKLFDDECISSVSSKIA